MEKSSGGCPLKHVGGRPLWFHAFPSTSSSSSSSSSLLPPEERSKTEDPLETYAEKMHDFYHEARAKALKHALATTPVIIAQMPTLKLRLGSYTDVVEVMPPVYTLLKSIAHIPLAIYTTLYSPHLSDSHNDTAAHSLSENTRSELNQQLALLEKTKASLATYPFARPEQLKNSATILDSSLQFVQQTLQENSTSATQLYLYTSSLQSLLDEHIASATIALLDSVHSTVLRWKERLVEQNCWDDLYVLVLSGHMPRKGEVLVQYFSRLLYSASSSTTTATAVGHRIIYAEGLEEEDALLLLGTHILDYAIGRAFWQNGDHMHRDIQADAAAAYLPMLLQPSTATAVRSCCSGVSCACAEEPQRGHLEQREGECT